MYAYAPIDHEQLIVSTEASHFCLCAESWQTTERMDDAAKGILQLTCRQNYFEHRGLEKSGGEILWVKQVVKVERGGASFEIIV